jgi:hypothetical protein
VCMFLCRFLLVCLCLFAFAYAFPYMFSCVSMRVYVLVWVGVRVLLCVGALCTFPCLGMGFMIRRSLAFLGRIRLALASFS